MDENTLAPYEQRILELANKNGLGSIREDSIQQWFELIKYFDRRFEPVSNICLWYNAGKQNSVDKLIDGGMGESDTVKYEKQRIEEVRKLMCSFND
jgi:hypothetical protein